MLQDYRKYTEEREKLGILPRPLNAQQISQLCELLQKPPKEKQKP